MSSMAAHIYRMKTNSQARVTKVQLQNRISNLIQPMAAVINCPLNYSLLNYKPICGCISKSFTAERILCPSYSNINGGSPNSIQSIVVNGGGPNTVQQCSINGGH